MATTPDYGLRYPSGGDNVDVATNLQNLALDVEGTLNDHFISTDGGALTGPLTVPYGKDGGIKIGGSGPQVLSGTKSPYHNDNLTDLQNLAVGSLWIQTDWQYDWPSAPVDSTVVWVKKWPTPSNQNQWAILYGDTGSRDLSPSSGYFFGSQLNVNLGTYMDTGTPFTTCTLRRINNTITAEMSVINFTTTRSGWEVIWGYDDTSDSTYGYSWGVSGNAVYGTAFQESSSTMKPFRVRSSGGFTTFEIYAPSGTATYSASVSFPAHQWQWPGNIYSLTVQGYIGEGPNNYDY